MSKIQEHSSQLLALVAVAILCFGQAVGQAVSTPKPDKASAQVFESIAPTRSSAQTGGHPDDRPALTMPLLGDDTIGAASTTRPKVEMQELSPERIPQGTSTSRIGGPASHVAGPQLHVAPIKVVLSHARPQASVTVYLGAAPAPVDVLKSAKFEQYGRMFTLTPTVGKPGSLDIRLVPDRAEYGSYRLLLRSGQISAHVDVEIVGPTAPQSLTQPAFYPRLDLDEQYAEGTVLAYSLEGPADIEYVWSVNGEQVLRGVNARHLNTCLHQVGPCQVSVILKRHKQQISRAKGTTTVMPVAPIPWEVQAGVQFDLVDVLPAGYQAYRWTVDGLEVSNTRNLQHRFDAAGKHRLDGYASQPESPTEPRTHIHVAYDVAVSASG